MDGMGAVRTSIRRETMKKEFEQLAAELKKRGVEAEFHDDSLHVKDRAGSAEGIIKNVGSKLGVEYVLDRKACSPSCPVCQGHSPIVRVAGFSAYFTDMHKEVQDQIIARTQQRLV